MIPENMYGMTITMTYGQTTFETTPEHVKQRVLNAIVSKAPYFSVLAPDEDTEVFFVTSQVVSVAFAKWKEH